MSYWWLSECTGLRSSIILKVSSLEYSFNIKFCCCFLSLEKIYDKLTKDLQLLNKFINNEKSNIRVVAKKGHEWK